MKTKIVYVLTSDTEDYYLEQTMVSAMSARLHNTNAQIVLVTDKNTHDTCINNRLRNDFLNIFDNIKIIDLSHIPSKTQRSRYMKTTLRELIEGDYLFIDGDTVICDSLEEIDELTADFAAVLDVHTLLSEKSELDVKDLKERICSELIKDEYFNSGVLYVKDKPTTHELYRLWHNEWSDCSAHGDYRDQPALYRALCKFGNSLCIEKLAGEWNCQLSQNGVYYIKNAKIFHFFATSGTHYHKFCEHSTFEQIKQNGCVNLEIKKIIENPYLGLSKRLILIDTDLYTPRFLISELLKKSNNKHTELIIKVIRKLFY